MTLLSDRVMDAMLAAAVAFIFPDAGRRLGMARNAMLAVNRTAACVSKMSK